MRSTYCFWTVVGVWQGGVHYYLATSISSRPVSGTDGGGSDTVLACNASMSSKRPRDDDGESVNDDGRAFPGRQRTDSGPSWMAASGDGGARARTARSLAAAFDMAGGGEPRRGRAAPASRKRAVPVRGPKRKAPRGKPFGPLTDRRAARPAPLPAVDVNVHVVPYVRPNASAAFGLRTAALSADVLRGRRLLQALRHKEQARVAAARRRARERRR